MATPEQTPKTAQIGMIGLAVMGENLARNIERNGYTVAVYNRPPSKDEPDRVTKFMSENAGKKFVGTHTPEEFVKSLERPRKIILLVKAGDPVDWTDRPDKALPRSGRHHHRRRQLLLHGHGAAREAVEGRGLQLHRLGRLGRRGGRAVGAVADAGRRPRGLRADTAHLGGHRGEGRRRRCVTYIGPGGAGHFVKMVHNGIEYGDMQLIAEATTSCAACSA
jgi:6-phosphogluconate dehydrogenase